MRKAKKEQFKFSETLTDNQRNAMNAYIRANVNGRANNQYTMKTLAEAEADIEKAREIDRAILLTVLTRRNNIELLADRDLFDKDTFKFFNAEYGEAVEMKKHVVVIPKDLPKAEQLKIATWYELHKKLPNINKVEYNLELPTLFKTEKPLLERMLTAEDRKKDEGAQWTECKTAYRKIKDELQEMFDDLNEFTGCRVYVKNAMVASIIEKYFDAKGKTDKYYTVTTQYTTASKKALLQFILQVYVEAMQKIWNK